MSTPTDVNPTCRRLPLRPTRAADHDGWVKQIPM